MRTSTALVLIAALSSSMAHAQEDFFRAQMSAPIYFTDGTGEQAPQPRTLVVEPVEAGVDLSVVTAEQAIAASFRSPNAVGAVTFAADGLPEGLVLSSQGVLSGSAYAARVSTPVVVAATDSAGNTGTLTFSMEVLAALGSLAVTAPSTVVDGAHISIPVSASGTGIAPASWSLTQNPQWLSISGNASTATISGTVPDGTGTVSFQVGATDIHGRQLPAEAVAFSSSTFVVNDYGAKTGYPRSVLSGPTVMGPAGATFSGSVTRTISGTPTIVATVDATTGALSVVPGAAPATNVPFTINVSRGGATKTSSGSLTIQSPTMPTYSASNQWAAGTVTTSASVQYIGADAPVSISVSGGTSTGYRVCSNATCTGNPSYTSAAGTVTNGQWVQLRTTVGAAAQTVTLTIDGRTSTWQVSPVINSGMRLRATANGSNALFVGWDKAPANVYRYDIYSGAVVIFVSNGSCNAYLIAEPSYPRVANYGQAGTCPSTTASTSFAQITGNPVPVTVTEVTVVGSGVQALAPAQATWTKVN